MRIVRGMDISPFIKIIYGWKRACMSIAILIHGSSVCGWRIKEKSEVKAFFATSIFKVYYFWGRFKKTSYYKKI